MQRTRSSLLLSLAISSMQLCWFDGESQCEPPRREIPRAVKLDDLRSAYLLREGVTTYRGHAPGELQDELRRHFDTVLAILELNTPRAIEIALDRLEAARDRFDREVHLRALRPTGSPAICSLHPEFSRFSALLRPSIMLIHSDFAVHRGRTGFDRIGEA